MKVIADHNYTGRKPRRDELGELLTYKPKILVRGAVIDVLARRIEDFIDIYQDGSSAR